jgi:cytochrome c oxidase cbb3-type subunit 3
VFGIGKVIAALALLLLSAASQAADTKEIVDQDSAKPIIRGGIVFKNYCSLCHGQKNDGISRAAPLFRGLDLTIKSRPPQFYRTIIRSGGQAVGASASMPPWQDELSDEQVNDVVTYLAVVGDSAQRGEVVYKTNCVLCHGVNADGNGRAAVLFTPRPADLSRSDKDESYKSSIIRFGGSSMGRSASMPAWEHRISQAEISDLLAYLRKILVPPTAQ